MANEVVIWLGDGNLPGSEARARAVARSVPTTHDFFVYGGDIYGATDPEGGTTAAVASWDDCYGDDALSVSPNGKNLLAKMYHVYGNHEYFGTASNDTTYRADPSDTYWTDTGAPGGARVTRSKMTVDLTKSDPNAAYSGWSSSDAQKVAAAQWSHLRAEVVGGWTFLCIDSFGNPTQASTFSPPRPPTSGDYYDAIAAIANSIQYRRLIVCTHSARYTSGLSHTESEAANMAPLWTLLAPKATLWIAGHNHNMERQLARDSSGALVADQRRGCATIVCGNGGANLNGFVGSYNLPSAVAYSNSSLFGFLKITIANENQFTTELISCGTDGTGTPTTVDTATFNAAPQYARPTSDITVGGWSPPSAIGGMPQPLATANGVSGVVTVPSAASPITDKWIALYIASSSNTVNVPTPTAGGGGFGTPLIQQTGTDCYLYIWTRPVASGDAGSTVSWTGGTGAMKATVHIIGSTNGADKVVGATQATLTTNERLTGALTPDDPNTLGTAYFIADSSNAALSDQWAIGGSTIPTGWYEIEEQSQGISDGATTRHLGHVLMACAIPSPVSANAGASINPGEPTGGFGTQESAQVLILWSPKPRSYNAEVSGMSPASYLKLSDPVDSVTAADASGNSRVGTYEGSPSYEQPGLISGESEKSVLFDGDDYITWNTVVDQLQGTTTLEIICTAPTTGSVKDLLSWSSSDGSTDLLRLRTGVSTGFTLTVNGVDLNGPAMTVGNAYHHIITIDGSNAVRWTQNGAVVNTHAQAMPTRDLADLITIGAQMDTGPVAANGWTAKIEKAAAYTSVLSDTEIGEHYAAFTAVQGDSSHHTRVGDNSDVTYLVGTAA